MPRRVLVLHVSCNSLAGSGFLVWTSSDAPCSSTREEKITNAPNKQTNEQPNKHPRFAFFLNWKPLFLFFLSSFPLFLFRVPFVVVAATQKNDGGRVGVVGVGVRRSRRSQGSRVPVHDRPAIDRGHLRDVASTPSPDATVAQSVGQVRGHGRRRAVARQVVEEPPIVVDQKTLKASGNRAFRLPTAQR